jgi:hypothetical protein
MSRHVRPQDAGSLALSARVCWFLNRHLPLRYIIVPYDVTKRVGNALADAISIVRGCISARGHFSGEGLWCVNGHGLLIQSELMAFQTTLSGIRTLGNRTPGSQLVLLWSPLYAFPVFETSLPVSRSLIECDIPPVVLVIGHSDCRDISADTARIFFSSIFQ